MGYVKLENLWRDINKIYEKKEGEWKKLTAGYEKIDGTWRLMFTPKIQLPETMVMLSFGMRDDWTICGGHGEGIPNLFCCLKAHNEFVDVLEGSLQHRHDEYIGNTGDSTLEGVSSEEFEVQPMGTHTHSMNHQHAFAGHRYLFFKVVPYTGGGWIDDKMLFYYSEVGLPEGWKETDQVGLAHPFPNYNAPLTGGDETHTHGVYQGDTGETSPSTTNTTQGNNAGASNENHSHTMNHEHAPVSNEPETFGLRGIQWDGATKLPVGICAFFRGDVPPSGWSVYNDALGRFIKIVGEGDLFAESGSKTHTHGTYSGSSGSYSGTAISNASTFAHRCETVHTHSINHEHNEVNHEPSHKLVMFCRYEGES